MNIQSIFNAAYCGIVAQGGPAFRLDPDGERRCLYRDKKRNRKCAAGHILPNRSYRKEYETQAAEQIRWFKDNLTAFEIEFLGRIQDTHDTAVHRATDDGVRADDVDQMFLKIWKADMVNFAYVRNLLIPCCET